jgi:histidine triad (HIT) family protein
MPRSLTEDKSDEYESKLLKSEANATNIAEKKYYSNISMMIICLFEQSANLHLIPIKSANDMNFNQSKLKITEAQLQAAQQKILAHL